MLPEKFQNRYFSISVLLSCHRAWRDAQSGIEQLEKQLQNTESLLWEWRILWTGTCALLRSSIHLIGQDAKACHNQLVANELRLEWEKIKSERDNHSIYWEFINKERNAILKEYQWSAYEEYLDQEGNVISGNRLPSLLLLTSSRKNLVMRSGAYQDQPCIEVVKEASDWVHSRIQSAVERAGFSLDEKVHFLSWSREPEIKPENSLLNFRTDEEEN